jgi:hypothetical protein
MEVQYHDNLAYFKGIYQQERDDLLQRVQGSQIVEETLKQPMTVPKALK